MLGLRRSLSDHIMGVVHDIGVFGILVPMCGVLILFVDVRVVGTRQFKKRDMLAHWSMVLEASEAKSTVSKSVKLLVKALCCFSLWQETERQVGAWGKEGKPVL